jgi:hypothetical protein
MSKAGAALLDRVQRQYEKRSWNCLPNYVRFMTAKTSTHAGIEDYLSCICATGHRFHLSYISQSNAFDDLQDLLERL